MTTTVKIILTLVLLSTAVHINAQTKQRSNLFQTIQAKDSLLFDVGFNQCNLDRLKTLIDEDVEFYHDLDGITKSRKKFIASIKTNLCASGKNSIHRVNNKASLQVFPLYKEGRLYGAIQNGSHRFGTTQAAYSHLWLKKNNDWKLSRVLSYNHHQEPFTHKSNIVGITVDDLKKYVGTYEFSAEFILTVRIKDGALYGGSQGQEVKILNYAPHKFIDEEQSHDLEFLLNTQGQVTGLFMKGSGMEMTARKK